MTPPVPVPCNSARDILPDLIKINYENVFFLGPVNNLLTECCEVADMLGDAPFMKYQ
jgi:hypothetical protein